MRPATLRAAKRPLSLTRHNAARYPCSPPLAPHPPALPPRLPNRDPRRVNYLHVGGGTRERRGRAAARSTCGAAPPPRQKPTAATTQLPFIIVSSNCAETNTPDAKWTIRHSEAGPQVRPLVPQRTPAVAVAAATLVGAHVQALEWTGCQRGHRPRAAAKCALARSTRAGRLCAQKVLAGKECRDET